MRTPNAVCRAVSAILVAACASNHATAATGTAFTYQGQLKQGGAPLDGVVDLRFWLYDGPDARLGSLIAGPVNVSNIAVVNGLFTVTIDFGAAPFAGDRWLQIAVASRVLDDADIVIIPGIGFGRCGEGYVRFALTVDEARTREAVSRIARMSWQTRR